MNKKIKSLLILLFLVLFLSLFISVFIHFSRPLFKKISDQNFSENFSSPQKQNQNFDQNPEIFPAPIEEPPAIEEEKCSEKESCLSTVAEVIDGDTVVISTGEKVRYIGINTPEIHHPTKKVECFGDEAFLKNKELVLDKKIRLEKDVSDEDKYGRLLRYVYEGEIFINEYLVGNGFASVSTFPPDVKFKNLFREAEKEAKKNGRGLWADGACKNN